MMLVMATSGRLAVLESSAIDVQHCLVDVPPECVLALQAVDVGRVLSARVHSSGTGPGAAWHLDSITVTHCGSGQVAVFQHRGWLDAVHGWEVVLQEEGATGAGGWPGPGASPGTSGRPCIGGPPAPMA